MRGTTVERQKQVLAAIRGRSLARSASRSPAWRKSWPDSSRPGW
jgi:hypothetical protein